MLHDNVSCGAGQLHVKRQGKACTREHLSGPTNKLKCMEECNKDALAVSQTIIGNISMTGDPAIGWLT